MENISKKDGFIFYRSFYDSINALDESMQLEVYQALAEYGLSGKIKDDLSPITKALLTAMIPTIDNANKRYVASVQNGKKGGRPKKNKEVKEEVGENLEKPNQNLNKPSNNLTKPNPNPSVSVSVYDTDTEDMIKDKKIKEKDKTVAQAQRSLNYITELLLKKELIYENEVQLVDDMIKSYLSSFSAIDIKCKCEYILEKMKVKDLNNRMNYFKSSFEKNIYQDFAKESKETKKIEKIPIDNDALDMLSQYD